MRHLRRQMYRAGTNLLLSLLILAGASNSYAIVNHAPRKDKTSPLKATEQHEIRLEHSGIEITEDTRIAPGTYHVGDPEGSGVILIRADGVTLDFGGAELVGCNENQDADGYQGIGIVADSHSNITIRNARIRGFKVGIHIRGGEHITIENCDLSTNFRMRLKSTPEREDGADWLWPHHNDANEWMTRYGAGIYVEECNHAFVHDNKGHHSQNGIILDTCADSQVYDNDFSFNSGWGLGMWRSSRNVISHNKFDWCVRGYSHGVYARGQDSSGILIFEQCHENVFAYNSATHGGDGFFLYAGNQTLRETGKGGCNHNLLYRNDFSHAVANGIEATFSDGNKFIENILDECEHGIWGGYSYNTRIEGNHIADSLDAGIAIEHGHNNWIEGNTFVRNRTGIRLWWADNRDLLESVYGQKQCTDSTHNTVRYNRFESDSVGVDLRNTSNSMVAQNAFFEVTDAIQADSLCSNLTQEPNFIDPESLPFDLSERTHDFEPPQVPGTQEAFLPVEAFRGRDTMLVDEWGPYDFTTPHLWPNPQHAGTTATFYLYGPPAPFRVLDCPARVSVEPMSGISPASLAVAAKQPGYHSFDLAVDVGGSELHATGSLLKADWHVRFFHWEIDPREGQAAWDTLLVGPAVDEMRLEQLQFAWGMGSPSPKVHADGFGTLATTEVPLDAGQYEIRTVSDDGIRVWIDGKLVIENWTWHGPTEDTAVVQLESGVHTVRVEHFELDGWAALSLVLRRRDE